MARTKLDIGFYIVLVNLINCANCNDVMSLQMTGSNCTLLEPLYNINFNMTSLHSELGHSVYSDSRDKVTFNVCGKLAVKCDGRENVAACLTKPNKKQIVLGKESDFTLVNGRLHFTFSSGDICRPGLNYSLNVILICDYNGLRNQEPLNIVENNCGMFIFWKSELACAPLPTRLLNNKCSVQNNVGDTFNLMSLSNNNHQVSDKNGSHFIISVCKPVHYAYEEMCAPGSSICFVDKNAKTINEKFLDYGQTDPNPNIENNKLVMNFDSKIACTKSENVSSKIIFSCDPGKDPGSPTYGGLEGCAHIFKWETSLACTKRPPCTAIDPITGFKFDFSPLSNRIYNASINDQNYVFGICNIPEESPCLGHSGACRTEKNGQSIGIGEINNTILFNVTGSPYLVYKGGSICEKNKYWSTKIEFICETDKVSKMMTQIVENKDCQVVIQIETTLACQEQISCSTKNITDDTEIDLSWLKNSVTNYEAKIGANINETNTKYFINVCRPLIPVYGLGCPGGSAACKAISGAKTPENEESLGFPDVSLTIVGQKAQLKYLRGSICEKDPDIELSSVIEFHCDPKSGDGQPVLVEIMHDCHYVFDWATNIICPSTKAIYRAKTCEIYNDQNDVILELKNLTENGVIKINSNSVEIDIDLCQKDANVEVDYQKRAVSMDFAMNGNCKGDKITVELKFECRDTELQETITEMESCHLVLTQKTPLICPFFGVVLQAKADEKNKTMPPDSHTNGTHDGNSIAVHDHDVDDAGISGTGIFMIVLTISSLVLIAGYAVLRDPERRAYLQSLIRKRSAAVQYSRVRTNEEASLLLHVPGTVDSDDELLI